MLLKVYCPPVCRQLCRRINAKKLRFRSARCCGVPAFKSRRSLSIYRSRIAADLDRGKNARAEFDSADGIAILDYRMVRNAVLLLIRQLGIPFVPAEEANREFETRVNRNRCSDRGSDVVDLKLIRAN